MKLKSFMGHAEWVIEYGGGTYKRILDLSTRRITWMIKESEINWAFVEPEIEIQIEEMYQKEFCGSVAH